MVAREGEESYEIELLEGVFKKAPRRFLKPYVEDKWNGSPKPLFFHRRTVPDTHTQADEQEVEEILDDRILPNGRREYLTHWVGEPREEATWEPVGSFVPRYNAGWVAYCKRKGILLELSQALQADPGGRLHR